MTFFLTIKLTATVATFDISSLRGRVVKNAVLRALAIETVVFQNLLASFFCVLQKDTLRYFSVLGSLS